MDNQQKPPADLLQAATLVRKNAHAPYSKFQVGAAIRAANGIVYRGCNVENVAYPEGTCAEAGAIAAMVADGQTQISEIVVIANSPSPVPPCGGCRQKIREFAKDDVLIHLATTEGKTMNMRLDALLPGAFGIDHMSQAKDATDD